jgi:hypothetical protein
MAQYFSEVAARPAATRGLDAQMPLEYGAGWVRQPCLRWQWRSWVVATATAEMPRQVAGNQLAVVEAAGNYVVQGGLIGDWTITSFEKIARGLIYRAEGAEVFSGRPDVQRDRSAWAIRCERCASAAGGGPRSASRAGSSREGARTRSAGATRAFAGAAGVLVAGRSGGRRGDAHRYPACHRALGRRRDASRIGPRAGDGSRR